MMNAFIWTVITVSVAAVMLWLAMKAIQWAKKGTKGAALLATIAFPNPGQPSPQQQTEEENTRKKESGAGRPK